MIRYKPYPAYKDSGTEWLGEVPEGWEVKRLRHVASFKNSNVDKKTYEDQIPVKLCNYTDVYYNELITKNLSFMPSTASANEIEQFSLKKGDVIITKDSGNKLEIGVPALVSEEIDGIVCGYHMTIIRCDNFDTARLLHRILQSRPTKAHFLVKALGVTIYGLSQDAIADTSFCLPPGTERRKIVDHIDHETSFIDTLIKKNTRLMELLKEKRSALITHAVTKGLDPNAKMKDSGVEWIGEVPEGWETLSIKRAATLRNDRRNDAPDGWTYIGLEDIEPGSGKYAPTEVESRQSKDSMVAIFRSSDILYGKLRPYLRKSIIADRDGMCSTEFLVLEAGRVMPSWLHRWLLTPDVTQQIEAGCDGAKMPRTDWDHVGSITMPLPPPAEQSAIANFIDHETASIDTLIAKTKLSIDILKERRSAFITAAVTGQIDIREAA